MRIPFRAALCLAVHATWKVFWGVLKHSWGYEVNAGDTLMYPYTITIKQEHVPWYSCRLKT